MENKNDRQILVVVSKELAELIKQAQLRAEILNRSEFLRMIIENSCKDILKQS